MNDLISRQQAIDAIEAEKIAHGQYLTSSYVGYEMAENVVKQLPPIQPEQTNCDYCHEDVDGYVKPIEKNNHAFVRFGMNGWELSLRTNGWHGSTKIMYCPMCGRELKHG